MEREIQKETESWRDREREKYRGRQERWREIDRLSKQ